MGEYFESYLKNALGGSYEAYKSGRCRVEWKESALDLFGAINQAEEFIDENTNIGPDDKEILLGYWVAMYKERSTTLQNEVERYKKQVLSEQGITKKYRRHRNILAVLCAVLLVVCIALGIMLGTAQSAGPVKAETPEADAGLSVQEPEPAHNYVASVNSDKYHVPSCDYAKNIAEKNRVWYTTEADAKRDGKAPCSRCRP